MAWGQVLVPKPPEAEAVSNRGLDKTCPCSYIVVVKDLAFSWDARKSRSNLEKHGVTFAEARTVFFDECAIEFFDEPHSEEGDRFLLLGLSAHARLLLVSHCYREDEGIIRIISARPATKSESKHYRRS